MKKDVLNLPDHYILQAVIDLKKNKKQALGVKLSALINAAIMVLVAVKFVPLKSAYAGASLGMVKLGVIIAGMVAYIILHELVHGLSAGKSLFMVLRDYMPTLGAALIIAEVII